MYSNRRVLSRSRKKRRVKAKPAWNSDQHDLSVYKLSKESIKRRKEQRRPRPTLSEPVVGDMHLTTHVRTAVTPADAQRDFRELHGRMDEILEGLSLDEQCSPPPISIGVDEHETTHTSVDAHAEHSPLPDSTVSTQPHSPHSPAESQPVDVKTPVVVHISSPSPELRDNLPPPPADDQTDPAPEPFGIEGLISQLSSLSGIISGLGTEIGRLEGAMERVGREQTAMGARVEQLRVSSGVECPPKPDIDTQQVPVRTDPVDIDIDRSSVYIEDEFEGMTLLYRSLKLGR
eukprot:gnl/Dysnectes_brevis/4000_a5217_683.p1 GENE.gnl/Dysnectes_brevis/4000_a5217_683~~gnl/Dysnectes_brevis/4000_a5217_683.p1  ORF type:complete len:301 (+),score=38.56 gnl/Dysnectes_brevis/4000_a5217_683:37-903(+)